MLVIERTKPKSSESNGVSMIKHDEDIMNEEHRKLNERIDELDTLLTNLTFGGEV